MIDHLDRIWTKLGGLLRFLLSINPDIQIGIEKGWNPGVSHLDGIRSFDRVTPCKRLLLVTDVTTNWPEVVTKTDRGKKYVSGPTQIHYSPSHSARVKMNSQKNPKHIYGQVHTSHISLWRALIKRNVFKNDSKTIWTIFLSPALPKKKKKMARTLLWLLDCDWLLTSYHCFILPFQWFISAS